MFFRSKKRPLRAVQIEVTSRCTRRCAICPRSVLRDRWLDHDMGDEVWEKIKPAFSLAGHVHLQGWGEPLLHASLPKMTRDAKASGANVGITTNGDLLDSAIDWILRESVDLLTLSVAGSAGAHARLRDGSNIEKVMSHMEKLTARAKESKSRIKVQVSYLLTKDNAGKLPLAVELAAMAHADEFFVTHLDVTPSKELIENCAFDEKGLLPGVKEFIYKAKMTAKQRRIKFRAPSVKPEETLACALNPVRFIYVTADGRVGPCVNLLFPVRGKISRWTFGGASEVEQLCYGDLRDGNFNEILESEKRRAFIVPFIRRLNAESRFLKDFGETSGTKALREIDRFDRRRSETLEENPFPAQCRGCHKIMGW